MRRMTPRENRFASAYASTGDAAYAAHKAEYSMPEISGYQVLRRPVVQESIKRQQQARLNNELLPLALDTIEGILKNPKATDSNKNTAAGLVLKYTVGSGAEGGQEKEPHEMTADELQQQIARLRREAAERAKPVIDAEASSIDENSQDPGVFG